jgi:5-methylthioadenosine/S-adenosylhomocysteine deaminase
MMKKADTLFFNARILTVDSRFSNIENGALAVRNGIIEKVWLPSAKAPLPQAKESIDCSGHLVMPGLVNAHTHLPMSLFRGLADDLDLDRWLNDYIFPAEANYISSQTVGLGTRLSAAEMLLNGITTCCDGYFHAEAVAEAISATGMRASIGQGVIDFPAPGVPDPSRNVDVAASFVAAWQSRSNLLQPSIFCHSPYTCSPQTLQAAKAAAVQAGVLFQIHAAETRFEVQQCQEANGCSPVAYLHGLGILDPQTVLIHAVWVDPDDIAMIAESGAGVVHCPQSNMKLASGIAPVPGFIDAGLTIGLGTDGCASNNDLDLFSEMKTTAGLHKVQQLNPAVLDAKSVIRMATFDGARLLGLERDVGSLEAGKQADLIILDMQQPHLLPLYHPASHIVYAARGSDVRHVMVAGRWIVQDRQLITLDLALLIKEIGALSQKIGRGVLSS